MSVALHCFGYYLVLYPKKHHKDFTFQLFDHAMIPIFSYVPYRTSIYTYWGKDPSPPSLALVFLQLVAAGAWQECLG